MTEKRLLDGKTILIVDDEPDVLDILAELLSMCEIEKASNFEEAKAILIEKEIDIAILDIMGVNGYEILKIANEKKVTAVMLTAHALSPENLIKSYEEGAASYIPKDAISNIDIYLEDILEARKKGKHSWWRWLDRFSESYFEKKFGPDWRKKDVDFWKQFKYDLSQ